MRQKIKCKKCKKQFDGNQNRKYCSLKCSVSNRPFTKISKNCPACKQDFYVKLRQKDQVYCSRKCRESTWEKFEFKCVICNKLFVRKKWQIKKYKGKFCSKKCKNTSRKVSVNCSGCNIEFKIYPSRYKYNTKFYCSENCRIKFGPTVKLTSEQITDNNYQKFTRKLRGCVRYYEWRKSVMKKDSEKCIKCGETENLTVHHKYVTIYDFVKKHNFNINDIFEDIMFFDVKNGETLCRSCHAKEHRK